MNYETLNIILGLFAIVALILVLTSVVIIIFSMWKIFKKAGISGWKSLVPVYNIYLYVTKIARKSSLYFLFPLILFIISRGLGMISPSILDNYEDTGYVAVAIIYMGFLLLCTGSIILYFIVLDSSVKNFGYDIGYAIGLFFLPVIFLLILALNSSKFIPNYINKKD